MKNASKVNANLNNVPAINVGEAVKLLSGMYCSVIGSGAGIGNLPSVMLWGAPGSRKVAGHPPGSG